MFSRWKLTLFLFTLPFLLCGGFYYLVQAVELWRGTIEPDHEIVYISRANGGPELYALSPSASAYKRLTYNDRPPSPPGSMRSRLASYWPDVGILQPTATSDGHPAWSPDGERLVYVSGYRITAGKQETYRANAYLLTAGSSRAQLLTSDLDIIEPPVWSPDGTQLALVGRRGYLNSLYILDINTRELRMVSSDLLVIGAPTWSVTNQIVFAETDGGLYSLRPDGTTISKWVPPDPQLRALSPAWSPDGRRLALFACRVDRFCLIRILAADGTQISQITPSALGQSYDYLSWSPDGTHLTFQSQHRRSNFDAWVLDVSTQNFTRLTTSIADELQPSWSPDGRRVLFTSNTGLGWDLYTIRPDGTDLQRLTFDDNIKYMPLWRPSP